LIVAYYSRPQSSKGHPDSDSEFVLSSAIIKNKKKEGISGAYSRE